MLNQLIGVETLSDTEQDIILDIFSNPSVKKYLRILAQNDVLELASLSIANIEDREVSKKHSLVQGKLSTIATLMAIQKPSKE